MQKPALLIWIIFLSFTILCAQGVKLHVHDFDHEHGNHHDQIDEGTVITNHDHSHESGIHFANDASHLDHHSGNIPDLDISPDGLLKKVSSSLLTLALLAIFFTLFLPRLTLEPCKRHRQSKHRLSRLYYYSPPLRAPPQH